MKRLSRLRKKLARKTVVPIVSAFSTMLERAQSTVLNLLNHLDDDGNPEIVEVRGCRNCGLIYEPSLYHPSNLVRRVSTHWYFCPACGEPGVKLLGPAPAMLTSPEGTYLVEDNGSSMGPYKTETEAIHHLWEWFDQEPKKHGNCEEKSNKEGTDKENKVIRLIKKDGVLTKSKERT